MVEIACLTEKGRLPGDVMRGIDAALEGPESAISIVALDLGVARALREVSRDAVPDMPDRIIAATALCLGLPLVTRDGRIRASEIVTVW
jgi:predicted nucleic acid-binding protein